MDEWYIVAWTNITRALFLEAGGWPLSNKLRARVR